VAAPSADKAPVGKRVALVTGASRGIGAASARALAHAGFELMLTARSAPELQQLARELDAAAKPVSWLAADALAAGSADRLVAATVEAHGQLDALVCCSGVLKVTPLMDASDEDIDQSLGVNLLAPMRLARAAAHAMSPRGSGRIVFIASTFGFVSAANYSLYTVAKAGLIGLARSLAVELAPAGIQVNAIAPGQVRTDMIAAAIESVGEDRVARHVPAGRIGEPKEIAQVVRFLVAEAPSFLTGDVMVVDGGYLCR